MVVFVNKELNMQMTGIARFAQDPELKYTDKNVAVAEFALAFNERRKVGENLVEKTHFLDFVIWDKAAELVCKEFRKGDPIYIQSSTPRQDKWVDKENKNRSRIVFRIDSFQFLPYPKKRDELTTQEEVVA